MKLSLASTFAVIFVATIQPSMAQDRIVAGYVQAGSMRLDHIAARADPKAQPDADVVTIPLKRSGKLLLIEAEVDGIRGDFIFDTGAPYLVLNQTYFRAETVSRLSTAGGITGSVDRQQSRRVNLLSMRGVKYMNLDADITPLGHIEDARGVKILGLFGLNLFKRFEMEIDVQQGLLILYRCDDKGDTPPLPAFSAGLQHTVIVQHNALFVEGTISGKRLTFVLDTGAETNTISSTCSKKVLETIAIQGRSQLIGTGSRKMEVLFGTMGEVQIGNATLKGMKTLITNMGDMSAAYGTSVDGMLGYEFLSQGRVRINFTKKELLMEFYNITDK